jgi:hypothetical protein
MEGSIFISDNATFSGTRSGAGPVTHITLMRQKYLQFVVELRYKSSHGARESSVFSHTPSARGLPR